MDQTKTLNRYRNLLVICLLLIIALATALFDAKSSPSANQQSSAADVVTPSTAQSITPPSTTPLFRIDDKIYGYRELTEEFQTPLYQIRKVSFEQQMLVLEQAIIETHIHQLTTSAGDMDTALQQLFPQLAVTEQEVVDYYQQNQNSQTPPFETLRPQLADYLLSLKRENAKRELLTEMLVSGKAQVLFEAPAMPASDPQ